MCKRQIAAKERIAQATTETVTEAVTAPTP